MQDKETRLCSRRYHIKDLCTERVALAGQSKGTSSASHSSTSARRKEYRDFHGRYVFPYDAEDIKAHKWFKSVP